MKFARYADIGITGISQMRHTPHFASTLDESRRILVLEPHAA